MLKNKLIIIIIIISFIKSTINIKTDLPSKAILSSDYIAILQIPKINLEKKLYDKDSTENNVDKNLMMIGDMPSFETKLIIAGHSGVGENAYFNDLIYMQIEDEINIYYNNNLYKYRINDIYDIEKTGKLYVKKNEKGIIILVTCKIGTNKQTIYKGKLIEII